MKFIRVLKAFDIEKELENICFKSFGWSNKFIKLEDLEDLAYKLGYNVDQLKDIAEAYNYKIESPIED